MKFVIDMVEKKEDLGNAIAFNSLMFNRASLVGLSIAGVILASTGDGIATIISAHVFLKTT